MIELKIGDVAFGGKGVGRLDGKAIFIPFTIDGEKVRAKIAREKRNFAEAELESVIEQSTHRVEPRCPYFGLCGGCSYQHISYDHQLEIKSRQVESALNRIAKLEAISLRPIVPSPAEYGYRNRVTVHVKDRVVGYYQRESRRLLDIEHCPIAQPEVNAQLHALRASRPRDGHYTLRADDRPRVFTQTNDAVTDALVELVANAVPKSGELLVDAYCGAGLFAKYLRDRFTRVTGIEWDRFAVDIARNNASAQENYICGNVDKELLTILHHSPSDTVLIVDPPATGLSENARLAICEAPPENFVYIACNPATLARDIGAFGETFKVHSVTPLDMFPQTAEIEVVVHMQRRQTQT